MCEIASLPYAWSGAWLHFLAKYLWIESKRNTKFSLLDSYKGYAYLSPRMAPSTKGLIAHLAHPIRRHLISLSHPLQLPWDVLRHPPRPPCLSGWKESCCWWWSIISITHVITITFLTFVIPVISVISSNSPSDESMVSWVYWPLL